MLFPQTVLAAVFAAASVAAAPAVSMAAAGSPQWTFDGVHRSCQNDQCTWFFDIDPQQNNPKTPVQFTAPAQGNGGPANYGDYTITSGWSGQFGPNNGFTTFAVVNNKLRVIAYPAYTDSEVADGKTVSPDRSYPVQSLP